MLWNSVLLAWREIHRNLLRSFLTILGIVIGVAAVITMVTLGNGATQAIKDKVAAMGSNLLQIHPDQRVRGAGPAPAFTLEDVEAIRANIRGLAAVAPEVNRVVSLVAKANNWSSSAIGTNRDFLLAGNWALAGGRNFTADEEMTGQAVCILGASLSRELFGVRRALGENVRVENFSCKIIGILTAKGQVEQGRDQDDKVLLPIRTLQRRLLGNREVSGILVSVKHEADISNVQRQLTGLLRERRHLPSHESNNFSVFDAREITETLSGTTRIMTALLGAVASVSLLVGGIGIMNIMLVSVTERTREIGVRLAIGAVEGEVLLQFLIEAVALSALGGLLGVVLATLASILLAQWMELPYRFDASINLLALVFAGGIGILFGYMPAKRAAQLDPIVALRHE